MTIFAIRHHKHEGLGLLEKIFEREKVSYRYLDVFENPDVAFDLSKASGLVVLGGAMGVYETDRYPFLVKEIELLRGAVRQKIPTLGICLGSQLLAAASGARVYRGPKKEIGWFQIETKPEAGRDLLLKHAPSKAMVFHWHGDTFDLPAGARHLAFSDRYPHQAFRVGERAWGLQFHLEITEAMIRDWIEQAEEKSKIENPEWNACDILTQTPCFLPEMEIFAEKVFREFVSLVKSSSAR